MKLSITHGIKRRWICEYYYSVMGCSFIAFAPFTLWCLVLEWKAK